MKNKPVKPKYEIRIIKLGNMYFYIIDFVGFVISQSGNSRTERTCRAAAYRALATLRKELCHE